MNYTSIELILSFIECTLSKARAIYLSRKQSQIIPHFAGDSCPQQCPVIQDMKELLIFMRWKSLDILSINYTRVNPEI